MEKATGSTRLVIAVIVLAFGSLLSCVVPRQAQAATVSEVSVSYTEPDEQYNARYMVKGKTSQGKTVWTYRAAHLK